MHRKKIVIYNILRKVNKAGHLLLNYFTTVSDLKENLAQAT